MTLPLVVGIAVVLAAISIGFHARPLVDRADGIDAVRRDDGLKTAAERINVMIREVTAYNVGVRSQTSEFPCIGAMGVNLCELVERGRKVCAANFVDLGTVLTIESLGECIVLDRMNRRYPDRVDIAMREDEIAQAKDFGVRKLVVAVQ